MEMNEMDIFLFPKYCFIVSNSDWHPENILWAKTNVTFDREEYFLVIKHTV